MKWAIVTPSYNLDFDQCQLMCDSVDAFVKGGWHHYIIVNKVDYAMFAHMNSAQRTVLLNSEVLPKWLRYFGKLGKVRGGTMWFSWRTGVIFGWHLQQIIKLNMASYLKEDVMLLCDSDVLFVRPLQLDSLNGKDGLAFCRLFAVENADNKVMNSFNIQSIRTLGLPATTRYVDSAFPLTVWDKQTVLELCNYIGERHKKHWIAAIFGYHMLSEGTLYALFIENIISDRKKFTSKEFVLTKQMRLTPALNAEELGDFLNVLGDEEYALVIPSPIRFNVSILRNHFNMLCVKNLADK